MSLIILLILTVSSSVVCSHLRLTATVFATELLHYYGFSATDKMLPIRSWTVVIDYSVFSLKILCRFVLVCTEHFHRKL